MFDFFLNYYSIITAILSLLVALITAFGNVRSKETNKLNCVGIIFVTFLIILCLISVFNAYVNSQILKNDDIIVEISLRPLKNNLELSKIPEDLPEHIYSPYVKVNQVETSGTFMLEKFSLGKGKSMISKFINYKCYLINKNEENFPRFIHDVNPESIEIHISLKEILQYNYMLNGAIIMKVRDEIYEGTFDSNSNVIRFSRY